MFYRIDINECSVLTVFSFCCSGGLCENTFYVDYRTEDGSANAGSDYEYSEGTLVFKPGETRKEIKVRTETQTRKRWERGRHSGTTSKTRPGPRPDISGL